MAPDGTSLPRGRTLRILFVGVRILPFRHTTEKNFWLDVIQGLRRRGHDVEVLSVMFDDIQDPGLALHRVEPIPMFLGTDRRLNESQSQLMATINYASRTMSLPRIVRALRRRRKAFRPDVIHFIENFGPGMVGLRPALGRSPLTITAFTYRPNYPLYRLLLKASYASFNVIVPLTEAFRRRLLDLRFRPAGVRTIRWGVDVNRFVPPTEDLREAARRQLGIGAEALVVFWAGFMQQTGEADLRLALRTAELLLGTGPSKFAFLFCFKPEHFRESYRTLERPGLRVFGSPEEFQTARTAADVFLAPIQDVRTTATPPLTWLECLAMGIPIVTTMIPGAEEAVVDGQSGFTAPTPEAASERIREIADDGLLRQALREGARRMAMERFSIDRALDEYLDLWSSVASGPRSRPSRDSARKDEDAERSAAVPPDGAASPVQEAARTLSK